MENIGEKRSLHFFYRMYFYPRPLGPEGIVITCAVCLSVRLSVRLSGFPRDRFKAGPRILFKFCGSISLCWGKN